MHDRLIRSLMEHQSNLTEQRILFPEATLGSTNGGHPGRADLISIKVTWIKWDCKIFEVKNTISDLNSDLKSGKWVKYIPHCSQMYFATPDGLIKRTELPKDAGLIVWCGNDKGWQFRKHPKFRLVEPSSELLKALLFRNYREKDGVVRDNHELESIRRHIREEKRGLVTELRNFGMRKESEAIIRANKAQNRIEDLQDEMRRFKEVLSGFGINATSHYNLRHELQNLINHASPAGAPPPANWSRAIGRAINLLTNVQSTIDDHVSSIVRAQIAAKESSDQS